MEQFRLGDLVVCSTEFPTLKINILRKAISVCLYV